MAAAATTTSFALAVRRTKRLECVSARRVALCLRLVDMQYLASLFFGANLPPPLLPFERVAAFESHCFSPSFVAACSRLLIDDRQTSATCEKGSKFADSERRRRFRSRLTSYRRRHRRRRRRRRRSSSRALKRFAVATEAIFEAMAAICASERTRQIAIARARSSTPLVQSDLQIIELPVGVEYFGGARAACVCARRANRRRKSRAADRHLAFERSNCRSVRAKSTGATLGNRKTPTAGFWSSARRSSRLAAAKQTADSPPSFEMQPLRPPRRRSAPLLTALALAVAVALGADRLIVGAQASFGFVSPQTDCRVRCLNGGVCAFELAAPERHKCICLSESRGWRASHRTIRSRFLVGMYEGERCEFAGKIDITIAF